MQHGRTKMISRREEKHYKLPTDSTSAVTNLSKGVRGRCPWTRRKRAELIYKDVKGREGKVSWDEKKEGRVDVQS